MSKKEKWRDAPELPAGTGMIQVKMSDAVREIVETEDPKYVWVVLFYMKGGVEHYVFRIGMHPLVMTGALAKVDKLELLSSSRSNSWVIADAKGHPLAALMRQEILSIEGVADYDATFRRTH